jgi:hypothetical protein
MAASCTAPGSGCHSATHDQVARLIEADPMGVIDIDERQ